MFEQITIKLAKARTRERYDLFLSELEEKIVSEKNIGGMKGFFSMLHLILLVMILKNIRR